MDKNILEILACPETGKSLTWADDDLVAKVNQAIESGNLQNRNGDSVTEAIEKGLVIEQDPAYLYPVRHEIPVLLMEESIPLKSL